MPKQSSCIFYFRDRLQNERVKGDENTHSDHGLEQLNNEKSLQEFYYDDENKHFNLVVSEIKAEENSKKTEKTGFRS